MKPRNIYIKQLLDVITNKKISKDKKNYEATSAIDTIVKIKPIHDEFKKNNPTLVIDPVDELDLNINNEFNETPLSLACYYGDDKIVTALLAAKADPNKIYLTSAPLIYAAQEGFTEIVAALLKAKADPNIINKEIGVSPLILAAQAGFLETVKKLLEAKADINKVNEKTGNTPLSVAAKQGFAEIVTILLEAKADPNKVNEASEQTPLIDAVGHDHRNIVTALLKAKADPNKVSKLTKSSPLLYAIFFSPDVIEELLESQSDIDYLNSFNKSAFDYSIEKNHLYSIHLLLKSNAKITNFNGLQECLSSQHQNDPRVFESLKICKQSNTALFTHESTKNNATLYLEKLSYLYENYGMLFATFINEVTSPTFLPKDVTNMIWSYDGRFPQSYAPPIQFLEPATIDPHLDELNREIAQKTSQLGLFKSSTIQQMDHSLSEEKQSSTKVTGIKRKRGN